MSGTFFQVLNIPDVLLHGVKMRMKGQLLFVQGGGSGTHDEWDNKLVESLQHELGEAFEIHYPRMPNEDDPSFAAWRSALEDAIGELRDGAILVGHSVGGTILTRLLAEQPFSQRFTGVYLLAAPFIGEGGWPADGMPFPADLGARLPQDTPVNLYHGLDDEVVPPSHMDLYAGAIAQARAHRLPGRNHQLNNDLKEVATSILSSRLTL